MANSFSIKVGADTTEFNKSLRAADGQIRTTTRLGDALTKTLEHKYDAKTAEQAQKQFQKALTETQEKAEALRAQLKHMETAGKVDTNQYRKLETDLAKATLEAANLEKKLEDVDKMKLDNVVKGFENVGSAIESAGKKLAPFSALATGALAGAVKLGKDAVEVGDDLMTLADKYEMSTTAIQRWQYVAMQSDLSADNLYDAARRAQQAIGQQMVGATNAATKALETLGIHFEDFDSNEQAFEAIVRQMSKIENQAEQVALATDIFGSRRATELVPLFQQSEKAIESYIKEFEKVGYLSESTVERLAELDNEINMVNAQFKNSKTELGIAMIPVYLRLIEILDKQVIPTIQKLTKWFDELSPAQQKTIITTLGVMAVAAPLVILVGKLITGVGSLIKLLPSLSKVLTSLNTPLAMTAIGAGSALAGFVGLFEVMNNWEHMSGVQRVMGVLGSLTAIVLGAAMAVGAFQSAWSLGLAAAGIVAGIVAVTAALNTAKKSMDIGMPDFKVPNMTSGAGQFNMGDYANQNEAIQRALETATTLSESTDNSFVDNSENVYNITIEKNEYVSADELVEVVSRKIAVKANARR